MIWQPVPGTYVVHQDTLVYGIVTEVRGPVGVDGDWLVEFRSGPDDDQVFCDLSKRLRVSILGPPL